jgi:flagellar biosynthesis protein FlhA
MAARANGMAVLGARLRGAAPGTDVGLALGVVALLSVLVLPLPTILLDLGLSLSVTASVLVLMVALFLQRPLDFTSFPTLLLLTTLLRLSLNVATTRLILSHGNEGPAAAGHVVAAFGGFLMGGDVVIGLILFAILLVVNFMVITKGSGRIAEVAARFSLDAMPGKQMAIDADLSAGLIDERAARRRRRELEEESGFYGAMDGAAKFVRGDAIAGLMITVINIFGGLAIGLLRHGMPFADAAATFTTLTVGDGLVSQIPALLVSTAAGIVVTKGGMEGSADAALMRQLGGGSKPLGMAAGAAAVLALMPGMPTVPFVALAGLAGGAAWYRRKHPLAPLAEPAGTDAAAVAAASATAAGEAPINEALRIDMIRLELGYGLLSLAGGEGGRLTEQIKGLRRAIAAEMGFVLPPVRIQDNMDLPPDAYAIRVKEIEAGRGELRPAMLLAMHAQGTDEAALAGLAGERTREPAFGLPALWIDPGAREEAMFRGCTVVDPPSVLTTHLTEVVRETMAELLSYAETQKLIDDLPREQQKLVGDLIPSQITTGGVQRVLQALLAERVSIRDLPTILESIQESVAGGARPVGAIVAHVRARLARQISDSHVGPNGYIPLVTLAPEWEAAFTEALAGPPDERQLAMAPSRLQDFMAALRASFDAATAAGETPVLLCSGPVRPHLRAIVERVRPSTAVLAQAEIFPRARIRTVGVIAGMLPSASQTPALAGAR